MNRKLLVTLLRKNIEELNMITDGFMEMNEYPSAIIYLAKRKTEDIQTIIEQLAEAKDTTAIKETPKPEVDISLTTSTEAVSAVIPEPEIQEIPMEVQIDNPEVVTVEASPVIADELEKIAAEVEISPEIDAAEVTEAQDVKTQLQVNESNTQQTDKEEVKPNADELRKTTIAEKIGQSTPSRNETLYKSDNSLSATIANKKVSDIKQAISIGDRFRFQRELFKGNGEDMNKTLNYLNLLATYEEAISFLSSKYGWADDSEVASDFYQIVKRKFL
ncbi:MAG: hypothetical protein H6Q20_670 [Bacteroidetes bacterium]|nr:hypothetical protein [Bacteroidota bacterium]